jgi:UDP-N-acetylmuramoyl-tripeptide--D-alanyl-D-alanine ligase
MKSSLAELQPWISGALVTGNAEFEGVSTDSRNIAPGNLFVALCGEHFDAHDFLDDVIAKGAVAVVVEQGRKDLKVPAMVVSDTRAALAEIAQHWRRQFKIPVIAVTGSNGKTTVKEMIASILAAEFGEGHYLATRGNLNNEIGVPLTVFRMDQHHRAAVLELGMNHPGEIAKLAAVAQPTVALVNNAQREHQEFMGTVEAVAEENSNVLRALPAKGIAVFPGDDAFMPIWQRSAKSSGSRKTLTFGLNPESKVTCSFRPGEFGSEMVVTAGSNKFPVRLTAAGVHNVRNALAAIACTLAINVSVDGVMRGLESFSPVNGRLQRKKATNGALVIDDTYNANPDSVRAAIDVLAQAAEPQVLVLGDMGEVGSEGRQFHEEIGAYARGRGIRHLLTLGELARHACDAFGARGKHFSDIGAMNAELDTLVTPETTVLVKGSRFMKMERVVQHLIGQKVQEAH